MDRSAFNSACYAVTKLVLISFLWLIAGCSPTVQIYSSDDPESAQSSVGAFEELSEDTKVAVVLSDGSRFEAKYRGISVSAPCFDELKWIEAVPQRDLSAPDGVWMFSDDEIQEVFRYRASKGDVLLFSASLAALIAMLAVYGHGDG